MYLSLIHLHIHDQCSAKSSVNICENDFFDQFSSNFHHSVNFFSLSVFIEFNLNLDRT